MNSENENEKGGEKDGALKPVPVATESDNDDGFTPVSGFDQPFDASPDAEAPPPTPVKRKRGRPPGSKNRADDDPKKVRLKDKNPMSQRYHRDHNRKRDEKKKKDRFRYDENGKRICGAKNKRPNPDGTPSTCRWSPMENGRCRRHGGKSRPPGPMHHKYKTGISSSKFSGYFGELAEAVDIAIDDEELLDARRGVAAALAAVEDAGNRLSERDTPDFRREARKLFREAWDLIRSDPSAGLVKLKELGELLERGVSHDISFEQVISRADKYRVAVNDALKLKLQASTAMNIQEIIIALDGMVQMMVEVAGKDAALAVAARFDQERLGGRLARAGYCLGGASVRLTPEEGEARHARLAAERRAREGTYEERMAAKRAAYRAKKAIDVPGGVVEAGSEVVAEAAVAEEEVGAPPVEESSQISEDEVADA